MIGERKRSKTDVTDILDALFGAARDQKKKDITNKGKYDKQ